MLQSLRLGLRALAAGGGGGGGGIEGGGSAAGVIWVLGKRGLSKESDHPLPTARTADPAVHSSELLGEDSEAAVVSATASKATATEETEPVVPARPLTSSSPRLKHTEVGRPSRPNTHQKQVSNNPAQDQAQLNGLDDVGCAGLDGSPWPDDDEDPKAQKRAQEADNKEYFAHHKASPLSELEFADSRKPITQATSHSGEGEGVILWRPEQLETAEETMLKAMEVWKWNKMRGDPHSPHGKILRDLRGEYW